MYYSQSRHLVLKMEIFDDLEKYKYKGEIEGGGGRLKPTRLYPRSLSFFIECSLKSSNFTRMLRFSGNHNLAKIP